MKKEPPFGGSFAFYSLILLINLIKFFNKRSKMP